MVDLNKLRKAIDESGMTVTSICSKSGILRATLYYKLAGRADFTASEIEKLSDAMRLSVGQRNSIFFANKVE